MDDAYDRSRKRGRSPSPSYYGREERRGSAYNNYGSADPWDRTRDYRDPPSYAARSTAYDDYRSADPYDDRGERNRAAEWDRYYRERESRDHDYRSGYDDRERYDARSRYDDPHPPADRDERPRHRERERAYPSYDSHHRRDDHAHGADSRANFDSHAVPDPMQSETLLPFRPYAQMIKAAHPSARDRSVPQPTTQELYDGYQTYKTAFNKKAVANFFDQRKDEAWFKEKYSVAEPWLSARIERKRAAREGKKQQWLDELQDGKLDQLTYDIQEESAGSRNRSNSYDGDSHHDSHRGGRHEPVDITLLDRYGEPEVLRAEQATISACDHQILIKTFPADLGRDKLEEVLRSKPGFRYVALGEPHVGKRWHRVGWAMYDAGIDMEDTLNALQGKDVDGFTLNLAPCTKPTSSKIRTVPEYANSFHRLLTDLSHCKQLLERFEAEERDTIFRDLAESNAAADTKTWLETSGSEAILQRIKHIESEHLTDEDLERGYDADEDAERREYRRKWIKKQLDLHLDLLRTVYFCDYYISLTCEFEEELLRRSPRHGRKQPPPGQLVEEPREGTNDESWARSVDQKTVLLLADERTDLTEQGGKSIDAELMAAALAYIKEEDKEKHRCTVEANGAPQCGKLFKAAIFVQKHILNKHRGFIEAAAQAVVEEAKFFNNYVRDPCRAISQPGPKEGGALAQRLGGSNGANGGGSDGMFNGGGRMGMIRFGNASSAVDSPGRRGPASSAAGAGTGGPSLGMRLGGVVAAEPMAASQAGVIPDPLPPAPKPLDPRAARQAPKSYQDLDGAAEGDVDLAY